MMIMIMDGQMKEDEMGGACRAHGESRHAYEILVGNPKGKRPLGRSKHGWEDNIKMYLMETDVNCIWLRIWTAGGFL
jgi:hypothetical protein